MTEPRFPTPLLDLKKVWVTLDHQTILQDVSMTLLPKSFTTIIGPNGSGKTTLLRFCLGLLTSSQGSITRAPALKIGYMPQRLYLDKTLPLTVEFFLGLSAPKKRVLQALERVGTKSLLKSQVATLSGGELQRILLARALLRRPSLLVLDEPMQGVDVGGQTDLYNLIEEYHKETGCAVLLVSHDLYFVHKASDHVICLNRHICCSGHPEVIKKNAAYQTLFKSSLPDPVVPYQHHHDHSHDTPPDTTSEFPSSGHNANDF